MTEVTCYEKALEPRTKKILVVGDWVVDEHWVLGVHRSLTSSRTGKAHYRAQHLSTSNVESLCAAGRTASVLDQAKCNGTSYCKIIGVGLWHDDDTNILTAMLDPRCEEAKTPHQILRTANEPAVRRLFNLSKVLKLRTNNPNYSSGTTRMIRMYQHTGAKFELLQRIDWELRIPPNEAMAAIPEISQIPPSDGYAVIVASEQDLLGCGLKEWLSDQLQDIDAVVIKDVRKGVLSEELVRWLVKELAQANKSIPWFVSTKVWKPRWFLALPRDQVCLVLIPQMAAQHLVRKGDLNCWITRSGDASSKAMKEMELLAKDFSRALIVALPDGLSLLARGYLQHLDERIGIVQTKEGEPALAIGLPMASVFFPALITGMMRRDDTGERTNLAQLLDDSLRFTHKWMSVEVKRVEDPERWQPTDSQVLQLGGQCGPEESGAKPFDGNWKQFNWKQAMGYWKQAFSDYGIIEELPVEPGMENKKCLELWRAMTEVDGYVCSMKSKRRILQRVVNDLGAFDVNSKDSKSCMFIASPGSGKTYLVRCLAKTLKLRYLGFNITQMISKADLLDCFDTIVTNQAQNREVPLLVFIDEINAKLDNQHVYDTFLAPLEEGVYVRAGKTFHIDPCVWLFAGTEKPTATPESKSDKSDKASDFESRLTIGPLDLKTKANDFAEESEARIEKIYLGVSLLRSIFPDVRKVSKKVLKAFQMLPPEMEARELKNFVRYFVGIQYGEVRANSIPMDIFGKLCGGGETWKAEIELEGDMIEIRG